MRLPELSDRRAVRLYRAGLILTVVLFAVAASFHILVHLEDGGHFTMQQCHYCLLLQALYLGTLLIALLVFQAPDDVVVRVESTCTPSVRWLRNRRRGPPLR